MNAYITYLLKKTEINRILQEIEEKKSVEISEADRETASLISLCLKEVSKRDTIIVCENIYQAQKVYDELSLSSDNIYFYPKDDFIATELLTESKEFKLERIRTLKAIYENEKNKIIVTSLTGLLNKTSKKDIYFEKVVQIKEKEEIKPKDLISRFISAGYERCYTVEKQGDTALRGSVLDIFPMNSDEAYRIDFFGNNIETIKILETESQRSKIRKDSILVMPKEEVFFSENEKTILNDLLLKKLDKNISDKTREKIENDLEYLNEKNENSLLQKYLSCFIKENYSFVDYIPDKTILFVDYKSVKKQEETINKEILEYLSSFDNYLQVSDFLNDLSRYFFDHTVYLNKEKMFPSLKEISLYSLDILDYEGRLDLFLSDLKKTYKNKTIIITLSEKTLPVIEDLFREQNLQYYKGIDIKENAVNLILSSFALSFDIKEINTVLLSEDKVFKMQRRKRSGYRIGLETKRLRSISELKVGDYVVHYDYGIGRFEEIKTMTLGPTTSDYIHIKYDKDDSLYIPVENLHVLSKYSASEGYVPKLSKLNSKDWEKTKEKARSKASSLASDLLSLYSEREKTEGFVYQSDDEVQKSFEDDFAYELTPDQKKAIDDTKSDMEKGILMDRLVCGDVGFGKTEVALRAAFKAILSGKQVAYLAPTTILARQHYYTFKDRMDKYGVEVGLVSRFVSNKEIKASLKKLSSGLLDVIIGTHRLLSKDVIFKDLGLLIIDEEQRFGVECKEQLKKIKKNVDVLMLTATPIPRTLEMAITGIKNISLIETAPRERYPIQTYVLERNDYIVKDAIERELSKGGQVFYLYNRVEDIENIEMYVSRLVPEAKIAVIHGQMTKTAIENTIEDFIDRNIDVLVSTTIIETGIDIPNVNTLIVHDADRYGLSQLYQIKGRVGRSNKISYAYLMYDKNKILTEDAEKRLKAIKDFTELGSGFKIAVRDLSTRGAGEILGKEQSGFMNQVGVELYLKLLDEEIKKKRGEELPKTEEDIRVIMSRHIDEHYIEDDYVKIEVHTKISSLKSEKELKDLKEELKDRFGPVKDALLEYMYTKLFENLLNDCHFERTDITENSVIMVMSPEDSKEKNAKEIFQCASEVSISFKFFFKTRKIFIAYDKKGSKLEMFKDLSRFIEKAQTKKLF
ncbi:MAG: transcription-repair coupling factor [Bacillales bacterium]|nr:transcription-repair coupling factor [Bacillales bacterium]